MYWQLYIVLSLLTAYKTFKYTNIQCNVLYNLQTSLCDCFFYESVDPVGESDVTEHAVVAIESES